MATYAICRSTKTDLPQHMEQSGYVFFQAEDVIGVVERSRGLGHVYQRQATAGLCSTAAGLLPASTWPLQGS